VGPGEAAERIGDFRGRLWPSLGVEAVLTVPLVPADQPGQLADLAGQPVKLTVRGVAGVLLRDDLVGEVAATPRGPARCPLQLGLIRRQAPAPLHLILSEPVPLCLELLDLLASGPLTSSATCGPSAAALVRHHTGLREKNAIFSGG